MCIVCVGGVSGLDRVGFCAEFEENIVLQLLPIPSYFLCYVNKADITVNNVYKFKPENKIVFKLPKHNNISHLKKIIYFISMETIFF